MATSLGDDGDDEVGRGGWRKGSEVECSVQGVLRPVFVIEHLHLFDYGVVLTF